MSAKAARQMSERGLAREGGQAISTLLKKKPRAKKVEITLGADGQERVEIPREALQLLRDALVKMGEGVTVQLQPVREELTTQEAADILNVSRPYLVKLLDQGVLPSHKVGTHRRVSRANVMAYKKALQEKQHKALDDLAQQAQKLGMGYG